MKQRVGKGAVPALEKARLLAWQIKDGKVVGLKGSVLDGAVGQPALAAEVAVGSRQTGIDPGSLRGPTGRIEDWPVFKPARLGQIAVSQSC